MFPPKIPIFYYKPFLTIAKNALIPVILLSTATTSFADRLDPACVSAAYRECNMDGNLGYISAEECITKQLDFCPMIVEVVGYRDQPWWNVPLDFLFPATTPNAPDNDYVAPSPQNDSDDGTPREETCKPVDIASGEKRLHEEDYEGIGDAALNIKREYNRLNTGIFGGFWGSSFDKRLAFQFPDQSYCRVESGMALINCNGTMNSSTLDSVMLIDGGAGLIFKWSAIEQKWKIDKDKFPKISLEQQPNGTWVTKKINGSKQIFSTNGLMLSDINVNGIGWTFAYDTTGTHLQTVTHTSGKKLSFTWNGEGTRVSSITLPTGKILNYTYIAKKYYYQGQEVNADRIEHVTYPNGDINGIM